MAERPSPLPDADTQPFWEAAAAGRLEIQNCLDCQGWVFYPRAVCPHCGGASLRWSAVSGRATVYSYTVVHRAPAEFRAEAPYVVTLVELEEGPRLMTRLVGVAPDQVRVGLQVEVEFGGEPPLPYFRRRQVNGTV